MRVIAGTARRLPLVTPKGMETRPTTDRIKETLFNILQNDLPGCHFLDLFAGSGAIVGVLVNSAKSPLFTVEERVALLKQVTAQYPNVEIRSFEGLLVDFARASGAHILIRGLRAVTDFEYELQMSQTNRKVAPEVDTIFFTTSLEYAYLSSSIVKEVAQYGGDISAFVAEPVEKAIKQKFTQINKSKKADV